DRARVPHAATRWGSLAGDEPDDRFGHLLDVLGRLLLVGAADFADHHHRLGVGIGFERGEAVDERRPDDRVAADADARRLPQALRRELVNDLVGEGAAARYDADLPRRADLAGNDPHLAPSRRDQPRAVGADEPRAA